MSNLELFGASKIDRKEDKCTYTWTVNDLNLLPDANFNSIDSLRFEFNNEKWYLRLSRYLCDPHCFCLTLILSSNRANFDFQYSLSVRNEKNKKSINSDVFTNKSRIDTWYVERNKIYDDSSTYSTIIPNDTLKIICEVKIVTWTTPKFESKINEDFTSTLSNNSKIKILERLFLEDEFSDIKLVTTCGKELKAHKCIVAAESPAFAAMFKHDMIENKSNTVNIPDVDHEVLKEMLRFIYMGEVEDIKKMASELFIAADKYDIQDLKSKCEKYIANNITVENSIEVFELADKYNAEQLKNRTMHFMKSNIADMMKMDTFKEKMQISAMGSFSDFFTFLIK